MKLSVGSVLRNQVLKLRCQKRGERLAKLKSHAKVGTELKEPGLFPELLLPHRQTNPVSRNVSSLLPEGLDVGESREVLDGEGSDRRQFLGPGTLGSTDSLGSGGRFNCTESRGSVSRSHPTRPSQSSSIAMTSTSPLLPTASIRAATTHRRSGGSPTNYLTSKTNEYS